MVVREGGEVLTESRAVTDPEPSLEQLLIELVPPNRLQARGFVREMLRGRDYPDLEIDQWVNDCVGKIAGAGYLKKPEGQGGLELSLRSVVARADRETLNELIEHLNLKEIERSISVANRSVEEPRERVKFEGPGSGDKGNRNGRGNFKTGAEGGQIGRGAEAAMAVEIIWADSGEVVVDDERLEQLIAANHIPDAQETVETIHQMLAMDPVRLMGERAYSSEGKIKSQPNSPGGRAYEGMFKFTMGGDRRMLWHLSTDKRRGVRVFRAVVKRRDDFHFHRRKEKTRSL